MRFGTTTRRRALVLAVASMLVAAIGGAAYGASGSRSTPESSIELRTPYCATEDPRPDSRCRSYPLRDDGGERSGSLTTFRTSLTDLDGNEVGYEASSCLDARGTTTTCSMVLVLNDGPSTSRGTIVLERAEPRPFAVVGGTGAYSGASGFATGVDDAGSFLITVHLQ